MPKPLDRYLVLRDFTLDDMPYRAGSTFVYEDATVCALLWKAGFVQAIPKKGTVTLQKNPFHTYKYLKHLSKTELLQKVQLTAKIRAARAMRGEDTI